MLIGVKYDILIKLFWLYQVYKLTSMK